jgi:hypothetical protein
MRSRPPLVLACLTIASLTTSCASDPKLISQYFDITAAGITVNSETSSSGYQVAKMFGALNNQNAYYAGQKIDFNYDSPNP